MSEFEFSTLAMVLVLLLALGGYSYWPIYRAAQMRRKHDAAKIELLSDEGFDTVAQHEPVPVVEPLVWRDVQVETPAVSIQQGGFVEDDSPPMVYKNNEPALGSASGNVTFYADEVLPEAGVDAPKIEAVLAQEIDAMSAQPELAVESASLPAVPDVQFFSQQDESEHAALTVFEPLMRFAAWVQAAQPAPINSIDGILDLTLSQPKLTADIERALDDLRLDTDLPLRLYGRRAGQDAGTWQFLEAGTLYSGLRLTLQLASVAHYADAALIQDWFVLAQKLSKRLSATVQAWPDPAALASYAVYLHDLAQHLAAPVVVQLRKPMGLWPAYEVHQHMTQWGLDLSEQGQYSARAENGKVLYTVLNDINNPHAQDFHKESLPSMHANTLSFCLDLARTDAQYQPSLRLWHDMGQMAQGLQAVWCNGQGVTLDVPALMGHADVQIGEYYRQLHDLNIPAGSLVLRRLLRG